MRIAQIVISTDTRRGGLERFVTDLIKELMKYPENQVTLITCDRKFKADIGCDVRYVRALAVPGLPIIPSPIDFIKQVNSGFDICHLQYQPLFGEIAALACRIRHHTLITTIHCEMKRHVLKTIYDRILVHTISHLSHRIVCLTQDLKTVLVGRGLDERKVVVIPNAMHVKELQSEVSSLKDVAHTDGGFDLLFVGRLEERKGAQYLIKALSILNEESLRLTLKIVGDGIYKHKLESFVKQNGLSSQVVFSGYISREELLENYLRARCVVIPSLEEGTPGVAIEALALGKPIIATSIPGMEVVSSNKLGFVVPPGDCEALAAALSKSKFIGDNELHRIECAAKKVAEQFDWSSTIKQTLRLYQDCRE